MKDDLFTPWYSDSLFGRKLIKCCACGLIFSVGAMSFHAATGCQNLQITTAGVCDPLVPINRHHEHIDVSSTATGTSVIVTYNSPSTG